MAKFMAPRQKPRTPGFVAHTAEHSKENYTLHLTNVIG